MDWDDLRYVLAVQRAGSLSGAATALATPHALVERRLQSCQERLGIELFDQTPDGLVATKAGMELITTAREMEAQLKAVEARILGKEITIEGAIRISALDAVFPLFQPAILDFLRRYPSINVSLATPTENVSLHRRDADVVIQLINEPPPGLVAHKLCQLRFAVFASAALVQRVGSNKPLSAYPWIAFDERSNSQWLTDWLEENAPGARIVIRVDENLQLLQQMVENGVGVFFLPVPHGRQLGLRQLNEAQEQHTVNVWVLTLPELQYNVEVRAFIDHMTRHMPQDLITLPTFPG